MIIQNIKINNKDFILTIDNKTYLIDEYLYYYRKHYLS